VSTDYPTKTAIVADADVKYFGATGNLSTDDSDAFISALSYVSGLGGGTVFVPQGKYKITKPITIPANVSLIGDSPEYSYGAVSGTVLYSYVGKGDVNGTPFITLSEDSSLKNLSIYYPEQEINNGTPTKYSWTIKGGGFSAIENLVLVNSYNGIYIYGGAYQTVQNIYGTPLNIGMVANYITDTARFLNINFVPEVWENSGLTSSLSNSALETYLKNNATYTLSPVGEDIYVKCLAGKILFVKWHRKIVNIFNKIYTPYIYKDGTFRKIAVYLPTFP
jgi:hypothetical protein